VSRRCRREFQEGIWGLEGRRRGARGGITLKEMGVCKAGKKAVGAHLVEKMIAGYHREDVRPCLNVWAVSGWNRSVNFVYGRHVNDTQVVHDESPISGDAARSNRIIEDNLCLS
jgi:hypothetical protein